VTSPWPDLEDLFGRLERCEELAEGAGEVARFARERLGTDHAGLSLHTEAGGATRLALTDPLVAELDELQLLLHGGPGSRALPEGSATTIADTRHDPLWPGWSTAAAGLDVLSVRVLGLPAIRGHAVTLDLYSHRPRAFEHDGWADLGRTALQAGRLLRQVDRVQNLREALTTRALIGQAQGIVMERHALTSEQAMAYLRRMSQESQVKVRDLAERIVSGTEPR